MWYLVGAAAAVLTTFGFVPQIIKMRRTRSVKDISLLTLIQFCVGVTIWGVYGWHLKDPVIVAANLVSLIILLSAIAMYFRYRRAALR
ncbi:SemiSWEET family transporter [Dehalogenimonas sp. 4OHTPN]|uniref:SemiSWEET family transporter n=1 Tax=Dehalogenimonas sp. 4OHTPN TaxID=3166643 RepID=A0AAU8GBL4_9CHLR